MSKIINRTIYWLFFCFIETMFYIGIWSEYVVNRDFGLLTLSVTFAVAYYYLVDFVDQLLFD